MSNFPYFFLQFAIRGSAETVTGSDEEQLDDDLYYAESHVPVIQGQGIEVDMSSRSSSSACCITASTSNVAPAPSIIQTDLSDAVRQVRISRN